jgi:hypothetical protein
MSLNGTLFRLATRVDVQSGEAEYSRRVFSGDAPTACGILPPFPAAGGSGMG